MSIAPPSDIVLDVAQAADPLKVQAATAKLATVAGAASVDVDFTTVLKSQARTASVATPAAPLVTAYSRGHQMATKPGSPYQKFEAVVLQNFMQSILPKDSELFGDAFSADAYRSMLAEQLATQVARSGRLGIAHAIELKENALHHRAEPALQAASTLGSSAEADLAALVAPKPKNAS